MLVPEPCEAHLAKASAEDTSRLEVADILRRFGPSYAQTHSVSPVEGCDQRSLVTLIPQLELVAALDAIAKTRPTSGSLVRPAGLTWG